jgi:hypothetical protein
MIESICFKKPKTTNTNKKAMFTEETKFGSTTPGKVQSKTTESDLRSKKDFELF